ncbi:hypothetical protein ACK8HX_06705 [Oryzobacter sp. R7]|uniref:hypothetical protein n=1 Tax=Oryzobacter faecalis TaxID=3388656 RepID=UPI00398C9F7E
MTTPPEQPLVPPSMPPQHPGQTGPPQWPAHPAYGPPGWGAPAPETESARAVRTARTALGWSIGAAVGAGLALVVAAVAAVAGAGGALEDDYYYETLRGEVVGLPAGSRLDGDRLEKPLDDLLRDAGVSQVDIECPVTAAVTVSTVVVCRGTVDDYDWTGVVVFEDDEGSFAVIEL